MFNELIKKSCTSTKNGYNNYLDAKLHLHNVFLPSPAIHLLLSHNFLHYLMQKLLLEMISQAAIVYFLHDYDSGFIVSGTLSTICCTSSRVASQLSKQL